MLDQELQELWQEAPSDMKIKFNQSKLMIDINHDIQKFERKLVWRNVREIGAAIIVMIIFGRLLYYAESTFMQVGCGITIAACLITIAKLLLVKRFDRTSQASENFRSYLEHRHFYLTKEKRLLETVIYWYMLPFFIGYAVFGLELPVTENHWFLWIFYGFYLLFGIGVQVFIWWMNRHAVNKEFNPILERIETTLKNLESV